MKKGTMLLTIERSAKDQANGLTVRGVRVDTAALIPAVESTQPFQPVVKSQFVKRLAFRQGAVVSTAMFGSIAAAAGEEFTFIMLAPTLSPLLGWILILGAPIATFVGISGAGIRYNFRQDRRIRALHCHSERALKEWLSKRYDIHDANFGGDIGNVLMDWEPGAWISNFEDGSGKPFKLAAGEQGLFVEELQVIEELPPKDYIPAGTPAAISPAIASDSESDDELVQLLVGDAQALHSRTENLLATLSKRSLSTENQHVIKRVREDVRQMLALNRDLHELGEVDAETQAQLAIVLSNLNDELAEVLDAERSFVKQSIAAQAGYVKERRRALGTGLLLAKPATDGLAGGEVEDAEMITSEG